LIAFANTVTTTMLCSYVKLALQDVNTSELNAGFWIFLRQDYSQTAYFDWCLTPHTTVWSIRKLTTSHWREHGGVNYCTSLHLMQQSCCKPSE